jgi:hypothetical protein
LSLVLQSDATTTSFSDALFIRSRQSFFKRKVRKVFGDLCSSA